MVAHFFERRFVMGAGNEFGIGQVFNRSDSTIVCWVQDEDVQLFLLGPNRRSPIGVDVDLVKGWCSGRPTFGSHTIPKIGGTFDWWKFANGNDVAIAGKSPDLQIDFNLSEQAKKQLNKVCGAAPWKAPACGVASAKLYYHPNYTDEKAKTEGGLDAKDDLNKYLQPDENWGLPF
jgi:hypothetical protein